LKSSSGLPRPRRRSWPPSSGAGGRPDLSDRTRLPWSAVRTRPGDPVHGPPFGQQVEVVRVPFRSSKWRTIVSASWSIQLRTIAGWHRPSGRSARETTGAGPTTRCTRGPVRSSANSGGAGPRRPPASAGAGLTSLFSVSNWLILAHPGRPPRLGSFSDAQKCARMRTGPARRIFLFSLPNCAILCHPSECGAERRSPLRTATAGRDTLVRAVLSARPSPTSVILYMCS